MLRGNLLLVFVLHSALIFGQQETTIPITNDKISVIFDLNGVLVETSGALNQLGIQKFVAYALTQNPFTVSKQIKKKLFDLLHSIEARHPNEVHALDERGDLLPQCMCNWMKGIHTPEQLKNAITKELIFRPNNLENNILHDITHMMFTPDKFAQTQRLVPAAVEFVKDLKSQGYKLYILSNHCSKSFKIIYEKNPEFFELFDGIMISEDVGLIKPDPTIYTHLLNMHNIDALNACFIDDVLVNVQAAQEAGIYGILCPLQYGYISGGSPDIASIKKEFNLWRSLLPKTRPNSLCSRAS